MRRWMVAAAMLGGLVGAGNALAQGRGPMPMGDGGCPCGMMGGGPRGAGPGCGAMIRRSANVTVEETDDGAIVRLRAKDPAQVSTVQRHAHMMATCMGGPPPSPPSE